MAAPPDRERGGHDALEAQGRQPARPAREGDGGRPAGRQRQRPAVEGGAQPGGQPPAFAVAPGGRLVVADPAVVVAVDRLAGLEGGDLGHVEHVVDQQPVGLDPQAAVEVDGEVPERVGGRRGRPGRQQRGGQDDQDGDPARDVAHRPLTWVGAGR
jgi:hypothetical protein